MHCITCLISITIANESALVLKLLRANYLSFVFPCWRFADLAVIQILPFALQPEVHMPSHDEVHYITVQYVLVLCKWASAATSGINPSDQEFLVIT